MADNTREELNLDVMIRKFKGYIAGDNGYDELDFKGEIYDLIDSQLAEYKGKLKAQEQFMHETIRLARIDELDRVSTHTYANKQAVIDGHNAFGTESARTMVYVHDRIAELNSSKADK